MFFCFFFTSFTVTFLSAFQFMVQPSTFSISGPSNSAGHLASGAHFSRYFLVSSVLVKCGFVANEKCSEKAIGAECSS